MLYIYIYIITKSTNKYPKYIKYRIIYALPTNNI